MIRWLARQFARPSGLVGRWLIAPWLDRISREMNRLALAELDVRPDDDVLEIGFGGGGLLGAILAATSGEVSGVDVSGAMVARARRHFGKAGGRLRLFEASAGSLPLGSASVDRAVSVNSLYFWPEPAAAFAELARVLRPGGRLVVAFEPPEELTKWPGHRYSFRIFEVAEVEALMAAAGFTAIGQAWGSGRRPDRFCVLSGTRAGANG